MPNSFSPHFVGWFGVTCPVVIRALNGMRPPAAIRRMPPQYQDKLMASLAWDLAERLKFGIALGLVPWQQFDKAIENDPNLKGGMIGWAARDMFLEREGYPVGEPTQPVVNHFVRSKDRVPPKELTFAEHMKKNDPERFRFMEELAEGIRAEFTRRWGFLVREDTDVAGSIDVDSVFCGRNSMLDEGSPYYLRNMDHGWYTDFSRRVISRFSIKALPRWLCLRDRTNSLKAADRTDEFRKLDHHYTGLILEGCEGRSSGIEVYGLRKKDAELHKISGTRGTCRLQDECVLRWFEKKGLRTNPYTRWLHQLLQISEKTTAVVDWKDVKAKAKRYVPANVNENDELRFAQLYWCLSRPNPERYPYRFRFSPQHKAKGESSLRLWWKRVQQDARPSGGKTVKKTKTHLSPSCTGVGARPRR